MTWLTLALYGRKAFAWLTASSTHMLMAALALTALYGVYQARQADKWHGVAKERLVALEAVPVAQEAALQAQQTLNDATVAKYAQHAKEADNAKDNALAAADKLYAANNRVRPCANRGATRVADSPAEVDPTSDRDGQGSDAIMVSSADYATLTENTARLVQVHAWGDGLVWVGLAVLPSEALPSVLSP